ncbi:MAG TPA: alpha/beta hydrolase [Spirochaetia bacterium]|nr:alpha/beta hydrolase [Spirochaetia bacterium]
MKMKTDVIGHGRPLVLVPGGLTGWVSWKPHAEKLSTDYKVIRVQPLNVDLGLRRERLPDDYSVDLEVKALADALEHVGVREADFAAWSFGAEVTLSFAIANPDRVRTLTLIEPPAFWVLRSRGPLSPQLLDRQRQLIAMWRVDVTEEQLAWFTHFAGFVPPDLDPRTMPAWQAWAAHRQSLAHGDATYMHQDDIERVRKFPKPVLLFKSRDSSEFLQQIIDILSEEFRNATVHDLPGGHAMHVLNREAFLGLFLPFIR